MRHIKASILILIILISSLTFGCSSRETTFNEEVSADELKNTIVTPYYENEIDESKNTVFCSTFQMAWNELKDNFVVKLKSESENDELVLALIKPKKSLPDTVNYVSGIISKESPLKLSKDDKLAIPVINFNILKSYDELIDKKLLNAGFSEYIIAKALQSIKFRLDEKGAVLKSEAKIGLKQASSNKPKMLVFNEPFLLYLKEKDADYPYFAMWVNNTELLEEVG